MKFRKLNENLLMEESERETYDTIAKSLDVIAKKDAKEFNNVVSNVVNNIPDDKVDSTTSVVYKKLGSKQLNDSQKEKLSDELSLDTSSLDTVSEVLDALDISKICREDPATGKAILLTILGVVAVIEPTPVVDAVTAVISILPDKFVGTLASILLTNPLLKGIQALVNSLNKVKNEKAEKSEESMYEDFEDIREDEYDDEMEFDDGIFIDNSVIKSMNILYGDTSKIEDDQLRMEFDDEVETSDVFDDTEDEYDDGLDESFATAVVSIAKAAGPKLMAVIKRLPEILAFLDSLVIVYDELPDDNKVKSKLERHGAKDVEDTYKVVRDLYNVVSPMMNKTQSAE